jgi:hypothetical protein
MLLRVTDGRTPEPVRRRPPHSAEPAPRPAHPLRLPTSGRRHVRALARSTPSRIMQNAPLGPSRLRSVLRETRRPTTREQNKLTPTQAQAVIAAALLRHLHAVITTGQAARLTPQRRLFPGRSPRQSSANAARGGLRSPPEGRSRGATKPLIIHTARQEDHLSIGQPPCLDAHSQVGFYPGAVGGVDVCRVAASPWRRRGGW